MEYISSSSLHPVVDVSIIHHAQLITSMFDCRTHILTCNRIQHQFMLGRGRGRMGGHVSVTQRQHARAHVVTREHSHSMHQNVSASLFTPGHTHFKLPSALSA